MFTFINDDVGSSFNVIGNYAAMLRRADVQQAVMVSGFTHAAMLLRDFILPKTYHEYSLAGLFFQPYGRVVLQQVVVILSGFFFMLFKGAVVLAVLLILFRTALDTWLVKGDGIKMREKAPDKII